MQSVSTRFSSSAAASDRAPPCSRSARARDRQLGDCSSSAPTHSSPSSRTSALADYLAATLGESVDVLALRSRTPSFRPARSTSPQPHRRSTGSTRESASRRSSRALRPGGWIALWWTLFGEGAGPDAFIRATSPLLDGLESSPTKGDRRAPAACARRRSSRRGARGAPASTTSRTSASAGRRAGTPPASAALYGSFSPILRLEPDRPRRAPRRDRSHRGTGLRRAGRAGR